MNQAQFKTRAIDFASGLVEPTIADVAREFEIGTERSVSGSIIGKAAQDGGGDPAYRSVIMVAGVSHPCGSCGTTIPSRSEVRALLVTGGRSSPGAGDATSRA
jgi:hypothetical protein